VRAGVRVGKECHGSTGVRAAHPMRPGSTTVSTTPRPGSRTAETLHATAASFGSPKAARPAPPLQESREPLDNLMSNLISEFRSHFSNLSGRYTTFHQASGDSHQRDALAPDILC
jgi:hypothetical protein